MNPIGKHLLDACGSLVPDDPDAPLTYSWTCVGPDLKEDCTSDRHGGKSIATSLTSCALTIDAGMLRMDEVYTFHVAVTNLAINPHPAKTRVSYSVNHPPQACVCKLARPTEVFAFDTEVEIKVEGCTDLDEDKPFSYTYSIRPAGSDGQPTTLATSQPDSYTFMQASGKWDVLCTASDRYGAAATTTVPLIVKEKEESNMNDLEEALGGQMTAGTPEAVPLSTALLTPEEALGVSWASPQLGQPGE